LQLVAAYAFIIATFKLATRRNYKWLKLSLFSVIFFQSASLYTKYSFSTLELTVFNKSRHTIIGKKEDGTLNVYSTLDSLSQFNNLKDYTVNNGILNTRAFAKPSFILFKHHRLLIVDSLAFYNLKQFKPDYVLLTQSAKVNLSRLIDSLRPKMIIADGSNYKNFISRWQATCIKQNVPFHYTSEKGAFVIK